ncbi:MAG: hypothetical protein JXK94_07790 [Deltaproteobacteria bacterium]|nr:hypothetical protein [Deltaproteobacteria bacterium]
MSTIRKWFCSCRGRPVEIDYEPTADDEYGEPTCKRCGATPSADPAKTVSFKDFDEQDA